MQSFGPTTMAGGLAFNGPACSDIDVELATTGALVAQLPIPVPNWGGIATVGDSIVFGIGDDPVGSPDGVMCFTPGGKPPVVP